MPEVTENFIWIPVRDAGSFVQDSFRQVTLSEDKGVHARIGKLKSDPGGSTVIQSYYFDKEQWTSEEAQAWVKENKKSARSLQRRYVCDEIRMDYDSGPPRITGHAAVFDNRVEIWSGFKEEVARGAFTKSIAQDDVRALWNHNPDYVLGRTKSKTLNLHEDDKGLAFEIIPPDTTWAKDLNVLIKRGDVSQASFGFNIVKQNLVNDAEGKGVIRTLKEVQLFDVSPVTYPAYPSTDVHVRMTKNGDETLYIVEDSEEVITVEPPKEAEPEISDADLFKQFEKIEKTINRC